jgi:hypothetical protein
MPNQENSFMPMFPFPIDLEKTFTHRERGHSRRHHRCYTKPPMDQRPNGPSNWTRNKEMIFWFTYAIIPQTPWRHTSCRILLHATFALVGKRPRSASQDKTITFDGAQLPHTWGTTAIESKPNEVDRRNFVYKYK